uniref:SET domain-containing protein n=1 Tax=Haemonchus contortus TaxID=6289 RepID=A0A7I5E7K1_HAECO
MVIIGPKANGNVGGVGFLINSTIAHLVDSHNIVSPRLAVLSLRTNDWVAISVINAYAPTSAAAEEEREEFYRLLKKTIQEEKSYYKLSNDSGHINGFLQRRRNAPRLCVILTTICCRDVYHYKRSTEAGSMDDNYADDVMQQRSRCAQVSVNGESCRKRSLKIVINWEDSLIGSIDEEYFQLVEHLHGRAKKEESLQVANSPSPKAFELIPVRNKASYRP